MRSMTKKSSTPKPSCSSSTSEAARNRGRKESSSKARDDRDSSSSRRDGGGGEAQELKKGPWTAEEDELLIKYIKTQGEGGWRTLPKRAGLLRCGKSCRLRWMNYLRPNVKRGHISPDEEDLILHLHRLLGNRWSLIAGRIPGRTDNEIKNYWNTHLSKKLIRQGIDPRTHKPFSNSDAIPSNQIKVNNQNSENLQAAPNTNPNSTTTATGSQSTSSSNRRAHHHHHPAASQSHVSLPTVEQKNSNSMMKEDLIRGHEQNVTQEENQFRSLKIGNNLICNTTTTSTAPAAACTSYQAGATTSVPITSGLGSESFNINQLMCPNSGNSTVTSNGLQQLLHHHFNDDDIMHGSNGDGDDDVFSSFLNSLINDDMIFPCNTGDDSVVIPQQIHGNQPHHQQLGLVPGTLPAPGGGGGGVLGRERGEDSHAVIMNISASSSMGFQMMGSQWDDPFQS